MFRRAANPDPQHARGAPASAHRRDLFEHPVDDVVAGVHHLELGLVLAAPALGRDINADLVAWHHFDRKHAGSVVAGVAAGEGGIGQDRGAKLVLRMVVGAAHPLIDHILQTLPRFEAALLPPFDEDIDDAGVLADRAVALCAHPAVGQDLRDRILRRRPLFRVIGFAQRLNVIHRMIVRYVLQRIRHGLDQIVFADNGHVAHRSCAPVGRFHRPLVPSRT